MIGHEHDLPVAERRGDPIALRGVQREAAVVVVVGDPADEAQRVLIDRLEPRALDRGQRSRVGHVGVQDAAQIGPGHVHAAVDVERRGLDLAVAGEHLAVDVDPQQIARAQLAEVAAVGIDQELPAILGQRQAEVVAHALVEAEPDRHAQRRRQLDPSDPLAIIHGLPPRLRA